MSMSFGKSRLGLMLGATMALLAGGPRPVVDFAVRRHGRTAIDDPLIYAPPGLGKGKGRRARGSRMGVIAKMISQSSCYAPHQGEREIARRKVQMLRIELNKICKLATENPLDMGCDEYAGYDDVMQDLDDQIRELMPLAYGRKTHNAPRRVWRIECFNSSQHRASSRAPLKRNFYVRNFGYPIVLLEGGAA